MKATVLVALACCLAFAHGASAATHSAKALPDRPAEAARALALLNQARADHKLARLQLDRRLAAAARAHALDMVRRNFFSHVTPEGKTPFDRLRSAGVNYRFAGETIAFSANAAAANAQLLQDPPHRAIILDGRFKHVGVAAVSARQGEFFVADFSD